MVYNRASPLILFVILWTLSESTFDCISNSIVSRRCVEIQDLLRSEAPFWYLLLEFRPKYEFKLGVLNRVDDWLMNRLYLGTQNELQLVILIFTEDQLSSIWSGLTLCWAILSRNCDRLPNWCHRNSSLLLTSRSPCSTDVFKTLRRNSINWWRQIMGRGNQRRSYIRHLLYIQVWHLFFHVL